MYSAASRAAEDEFLLRSGRASTAALKKEKHIPDDDLSGKLSGIQQDKTKTDFEAPGLDLNDWEEELLRRSGIKAHSIHELDVRSLKSTVKALNAGTTSTGASPASKLSQSRGYSSERNFLIDIPSTEEIIGNIDKAIQSLEIGTSDTRKRIEQLTKAHDDALKAEVEAETVFAKANEKMKIIVKFQYFCAEYVGMIREKDTHILALKDELFTHLRERKENLRQRRLLDQEDLTMRVKENGGFISFGSYTPIGALLFEAEENLEQQQREYKRKFRISKRLGLETKSFDGSSLEVLEAELGSDIDVNVEEETEYASKITAISMRASKLLDDVKLDLRSVGIVVENFKEMKRADPEKYKNGYFGISLPGILEPLVLLDALSACTLKDEYILSTRDWHEPLRQYSVDAEEASDTGDEAVLLPKLVTKIFLPFAENFLSSHFDPFSSTSSKYALSLIEQILEYDPSTEELATVIQALSHECNIAQESICIPFLTFPNKLGMPLIRRQLRRYSKLLRNISLFSNILSPSVFHRMGWTFFGTRVAPALLNLMVTQEGVSLAAEISSIYLNVFRVDLSVKSRQSSLQALEDAAKDVQIKGNAERVSVTGIETLLLQKCLREVINIAGPTTLHTPQNKDNAAAAAAFIMTNSGL